MTGLLDFLAQDDAKLGLGLLAAAGPSTQPMNAFQRIQMAQQGLSADKQGALKLKLLESQIEENKTQDALRKAQLEQQAKRDAYFMGAPGAMGGPGVASPAASASASGVTAPPSAGKFDEWSQQLGVPRDALVADYMTNGGKGIADMLYKRGVPDMQVSNGYAYDKNRLGAGYLPQLNISQNGQASMVQVGPDGLPTVSAPRGAVGTYGAYQGVSNRSAADFQPERVIDQDPASPSFNQTVVRPRSAVLQPEGGGPVNGQTIKNPMAARPGDTDRVAIFTQERKAAAERLKQAALTGDQEAIGRARADIEGLEREIKSNRIPMPPAGNVVELSPQQQTANKAAEVRAVDTAKADVARDTDRLGAGKRFDQMSSVATQAMKLLEAGPTGSGAGALADSALNFVGQPSKGGNVAQSLEAVAGWMVANVPRMEGPQSNADVTNYQTMAGRVGDRTLPVEARKAALAEVISLQNKYAALNGGQAPAAEKPKVYDTLPKNAPVGKQFRNTETGEVMEWNGLQWKKVK